MVKRLPCNNDPLNWQLTISEALWLMTLFIVKSTDGNLLTKDLSWANDCEVTALFKTQHKDVALNQLLELNASDIKLRAEIVACEADKKNQPILSHTLSSHTLSSHAISSQAILPEVTTSSDNLCSNVGPCGVRSDNNPTSNG